MHRLIADALRCVLAVRSQEIPNRLVSLQSCIRLRVRQIRLHWCESCVADDWWLSRSSRQSPASCYRGSGSEADVHLLNQNSEPASELRFPFSSFRCAVRDRWIGRKVRLIEPHRLSLGLNSYFS